MENDEVPSLHEESGLRSDELRSPIDPDHVANDKNDSTLDDKLGQKISNAHKKAKKKIRLNDKCERTGKSASIGRTQVTKRKHNGRLVRIATFSSKKVDRDTELATFDTPKKLSVPPLPRNQYVTTLRRRAIRKLEETPHSSIEGNDVSLGMKLIVAGGRVIVQSLNSLNDGFASPAQLAGIIQRGDILLAIGNLSLVNLPIDQLMDGLRPLSTPDSEGFYERCLTLRFEAGAGLSLLDVHEQEHAKSRDSNTHEMRTLFPMVDQLSGMPLFEPHDSIYAVHDGKATVRGKDHDESVDIHEETKDHFLDDDDRDSIERTSVDEKVGKSDLNFDLLISTALAKERNSDRERYESEYFDWREGISDLLRTTMSMEESQKNDRINMLSKVERLEVGNKIMQITKALELNIEAIDKGSNEMSEKNWNSSISIRSGSSTIIKRQYNMNGTITSFDSNQPDDSIDEGNVDSKDSLDVIDSDRLLLGLAAGDEIWRKLVITLLNTAADDVKNFNQKKSKDFSSQKEEIDSRKELGYFLFRGNASKTRKKETKQFAFPPQEITHVLFDLTTFIATNARDDITVFGANSRISSNISSRYTKASARRRASVQGDIVKAKRYVLDEALPHWLRSFRPLKIDQRTTLWPRQSSRTDSVSGSYTSKLNRSEFSGGSSDADTLTVDSEGSRTQMSTTARKKKASVNSRVDHGNGHESETFFLVTYFCTEKIIGQEYYGDHDTIDNKTFIQTYGAYLQIQTCLSFASFVKDEVAISELLTIARNDPNHQDATTEIREGNGFIFYDSTKLSATLQCLKDIRFEMFDKKRKVILDLCVSGYPDIQPWQVRSACFSFPQLKAEDTRDQCSQAIMADLYYTYLSHLLNPIEGNEAAREDSSLIKEFCEWSIGIDSRSESDSSRMQNFMDIAAPSSKYHKKYRRDLIMLLDQSFFVKNYGLSLDLVDEIIGNKKLLSNEGALGHAVDRLREIGSFAINEAIPGFVTLRRVLKLYERISTKTSHLGSKMINIPSEIVKLLYQWKNIETPSTNDAHMYQLIDFIIDESSVPADVTRALLFWCSSHRGNALFPRLEDLLCRGLYIALLNGELSGTSLRLKHSRTLLKDLQSTPYDTAERNKSSIWESMKEGDIPIDK